MTLVPATTSTEGPKKTKAKQRYLRRKKERRKTKKKTLPIPRKLAGDDFEDSDDEQLVEAEENSDGSVDEQGTESVTQPVKEKDKKRSKKKRKTEDVDKMDVDLEGNAKTTLPTPVSPEAPQLGTQQETSLPSFPLPKLPNPPLRSDLALQGLDKALISAEIVDYRTTKKIPTEGGDDGGTGLSERTRKRLVDLGISELFAVQTALLPFLLPAKKSSRALYLPYNPPQDVCVSAPTGSGKTLAYVLPIIEILSSRIVTRLRALVVLPTRDLVTQVRETFEAVGKGLNLKIGTATGQHSFAYEQAQLVSDGDKPQVTDRFVSLLIANRTNPNYSLRGGSSKVDILICTPGRLIDHINGTPNFSLQHLRFLVIDEADRLLTQSFQDWLAQVLAVTRLTTLPTRDNSAPTLSESTNVPYHDAVAPHLLHDFPVPSSLCLIPKQPTCQKLLFSATLTRDPGKIAKLELRDVKYFVVKDSENGTEGDEGNGMKALSEGYSMPANLSEHMIVCSTALKPLVLFHLIYTQRIRHALVFTKSVESTKRLVTLFELFEAARLADGSGEGDGVVMRAYSSELHPSERKVIFEQFKQQQIHILVASDLISRGIDVPLTHTISYDVPLDLTKYVHRAGRTARAGREGSTWTLVEEQEARWFKEMLRNADVVEDDKTKVMEAQSKSKGWLSRIKRVKVAECELRELVGFYETALARLKEVYVR